MALVAENVRVAVTGAVMVGPTSAPAPTDADTPPTGFDDLGYISEDGVTEKDILIHDPTRADPTIAFMMANLSDRPGFPTPIGIFRDVRKPTAD